MWRETTKHERNLRIWREEFEDFIPERVLDFHVHIWNRASLPDGKTFSCGGQEVGEYGFDDLRQDLAAVYPSRQVSAVCFGLPFPEYNQAVNNRYVAGNCDRKRLFALRLIDPAADPAAVRKDVIEQGFVGFKPYPNYVPKADINLVEIHEMLPNGLMQVADELGLIVMLHIPRKARLADPLNQRQIVELCKAWPRARIILAHIGRSYYLKGITGQLDALKGLPNLYYDLAMLANADVLEYAFRTLPHDRLLYGSDAPIALAPGHSVEINNQYTYVTPVPWELSISDNRGKLVFTSFLYEGLRAIKKAVSREGLPRSFVEGLFHDHGIQLLHG